MNISLCVIDIGYYQACFAIVYGILVNSIMSALSLKKNI